MILCVCSWWWGAWWLVRLSSWKFAALLLNFLRTDCSEHDISGLLCPDTSRPLEGGCAQGPNSSQSGTLDFGRSSCRARFRAQKVFFLILRTHTHFWDSRCEPTSCLDSKAVQSSGVSACRSYAGDVGRCGAACDAAAPWEAGKPRIALQSASPIG